MVRNDIKEAKKAYASSPYVKQRKQRQELKRQEMEKDNRELQIQLEPKTMRGLKQVLKELPGTKDFYRFNKNTLYIKYILAKQFVKFTEPLYGFLTDLRAAVASE